MIKAYKAEDTKTRQRQGESKYLPSSCILTKDKYALLVFGYYNLQSCNTKANKNYKGSHISYQNRLENSDILVLKH